MTLQHGPMLSAQFVDKRLSDTPENTSPLATPANYASEAALDARLATIDAAYYTASRLSLMTTNDKTYAVRANDDAGGI